MSTIRPTLAASAPPFGRRAPGFVRDDAPVARDRGDDARLFALTFLGGFLFMTVYLA